MSIIMKSAFGAKRKARKILVADEEEGTGNDTSDHVEPVTPGKHLEFFSSGIADNEKSADEVK